MPAIEFSVLEQAMAKVREAYAARSTAASESAAAGQALAGDQARVEAANTALGPLQEAYLAAVAELRQAIDALAGI